MGEVFEAKVRKVGTSLGLLIPKNVAEKEGLKEGEKIDVALLRKNLKLIKETFGIDKGTKKFVRHHIERKF